MMNTVTETDATPETVTFSNIKFTFDSETRILKVHQSGSSFNSVDYDVDEGEDWRKVASRIAKNITTGWYSSGR
jgi:hypothetical protein